MALVDAIIVWIHLLATSIWVGGSILISIISRYVRGTNLNNKEKTMFIVEIGKRFNKIALPSLLILFATGMYNARYYILYPDNISSMYGIILTIKVSLVIAMTVAYIIHIRVLWKRLEASLDDDNRLERLRKSIINIGRFIAVLSIAILLLASILDSGL